MLGAAFLSSRVPRPSGPRIEADLDVVGVDTGGSYAWIIRTAHGAALVDAGLDPDAGAILRELERQGLRPDDVHTILVTHAHLDHWSGAARFPSAQVYVGPGELPYVRGERPFTSLIAPVLDRLWTRAPLPPRLRELEGDGTLELDGESIRVIHTPGHTVGSAMYLRRGLLFTGDSLLRDGKSVTPAPGFLSENAAENERSLQKLLSLPFTRIADGHAGVTEDARQKVAALLR